MERVFQKSSEIPFLLLRKCRKVIEVLAHAPIAPFEYCLPTYFQFCARKSMYFLTPFVVWVPFSPEGSS